jgi:tRNA(Ile)-lysidine synthase
LRPEESDREAELVRAECSRLGVPFEYGQFDVRGFQKVHRLSLQDAGRRVRFRFFRLLLSKYHASKVTLGHHADDQVETLLLKWIRGAGLRGLKGMVPIREGWLIRPLLESWRHEIELYAKEEGIPFLSDSSNLKPSYLRNRIRLSLIPFIEQEYQPNFKSMMIRLSTFLRDEDDFIENEAEEAYQRVVSEKEGNLLIPFPQFRALHNALRRRVLQKVYQRIGRIDSPADEEAEWKIDSICRRLSGPAPSFIQELPGGILLEKRYDQIILKKGDVKTIPLFEIELVSPGQTPLKDVGKTVTVEEMDRPPARMEYEASSFTAYLDYQHLQFPLKMRNLRPGDRFHPLGAKGTQKLKEFFIDHKVPRFERRKIPLLISGETIAWVVGHRIDDKVKVTDQTRKILRVEVNS